VEQLDLGGAIPTEIFTLERLEKMNFENANFSGTIPEQIVSLSDSLTDLVLNNNKLTGPVPAAFVQLTLLGRSCVTFSNDGQTLFFHFLCCLPPEGE
jgi:hypothetical protein